MFVVGFGGWGNALNVAQTAASFLVRQSAGRRFGRLKTDRFFRFDQERPTVTIENGLMHAIKFSEASLFASHLPSVERDLVVLVAEEPHLYWDKFTDQLINTAITMGASEFISLGSMYDGVLHTDAVVSGIASNANHSKELETFNIRPITYHGPTAIHALLHRKACERNVKASSLWTHCPYYLEGTSHPGLVAATVDTVARMLGMTIDTQDLAKEWERLKTDIQNAIEENPKLQKLIAELRRAKVKGAWAQRPDQRRTSDKVIRLKDFRELN